MSKIEICENPEFNLDENKIETKPSGFHMTFDNGNTISIQWASHNYSSTRFRRGPATLKCTSAEVAIWDSNDRWANIDTNGDMVKGWVEPDEIAKLIHLTSQHTIDELNAILEAES